MNSKVPSFQTRVLVTHGLAYLKYMDNIIVLKDGKVDETGTFGELVKSGGAFAEFLDTYLLQLENNPTGNVYCFKHHHFM